MATIGATLLVAYAVQAAAMSRVSFARTEKKETWLGLLVGTGSMGLLGIVVALALAERADVGHWTSIDAVAFAVSVGSLLLLGIFVALMPYVSHEWARTAHLDLSADD